MAFYTPNSIATRPVAGADSPYVMPIGVVTTYDPVLSGAVTLLFPAAPVDGSVVIIKNATADPTPVTLDPNGNTFEAPDTSDTAYLTTGTVSHSAPKQSYRWIYDGTDTWWIDHSYKPNEERAVLVTGDYTLKRPGEIVLADTSLDPLTVTVPEGWPDDSRFTITKVTGDGNVVTIQRAGTTEQFYHARYNILVDSFLLLYGGESVSYILDSQIWYPYSKWIESYAEIWSVPANTDIPLVAAPMPMTFALNTLGESSSRLWSDAGGVLTANFPFTPKIDIQATMWFDLTSNNAAMYATLAAATNAASSILSPLRAGIGASRQIYVPQSVSGSFAVSLEAGNTFQVNMQQVIDEGSGDADLGDSTASPPDTWGALVTFTVS